MAVRSIAVGGSWVEEHGASKQCQVRSYQKIVWLKRQDSEDRERGHFETAELRSRRTMPGSRPTALAALGLRSMEHAGRLLPVLPSSQLELGLRFSTICSLFPSSLLIQHMTGSTI